ASMGIYIFSTRVLYELLCRDANLPNSTHDFGKDIIPSMIASHRVLAYPFECLNHKKQAYWRDVGTLDAYYRANMDLISVDPQLNVYTKDWPIRTWQPNLTPPKFVFGSTPDRTAHSDSNQINSISNSAPTPTAPAIIGCALDSIVCPGTIVSGAVVERSVIGSNVRLHENAVVRDSILLDGVIVGKRATIRRAIIDKEVVIPENARIGCNLAEDQKRGFTITDEGVVVIAKGDRIEFESQKTSPIRKWHVNNQVIYDH
ncbi:MAG: sugar phosphate nucleotidyltransferase, partial [Pirellulaceae bacterium]|nr:sugar phosphate nucleotidyltransferase [Pirellulaceae bacterium]